MKKRPFRDVICFILLPMLVAGLPFVALGAADEPAYDWYFKVNDTHARPDLLPEADFMSEYPEVLGMGPEEKVLYLTFDAGYDNGNLPKILDTLQQKKVSAAFFVDGNFVRNEPTLVKRIATEGHILGNHTADHADMSSLRDFGRYRQQIEEWNEAVKAAGVAPTVFFRFPCGRFSRTALEYNRRLGLKTVFWSFAYYDWETDRQPDPAAALEKILSRTHNGCILLLHSVSSTNAAILPELIDRLQAEGYEFRALSTL